MEKADLKPEEVWYVGDQFKCDIVGARNAGILPVWYIGAIDLTYEPDESVLTIKRWDELKGYIQNISDAKC